MIMFLHDYLLAYEISMVMNLTLNNFSDLNLRRVATITPKSPGLHIILPKIDIYFSHFLLFHLVVGC